MTPDGLVYTVHGQLLRDLCKFHNCHFQGLSHAVRRTAVLHRALRKRLLAIDTAFSMLRHISEPSCNDVVAQVRAYLQEGEKGEFDDEGENDMLKDKGEKESEFDDEGAKDMLKDEGEQKSEFDHDGANDMLKDEGEKKSEFDHEDEN